MNGSGRNGPRKPNRNDGGGRLNQRNESRGQTERNDGKERDGRTSRGDRQSMPSPSHRNDSPRGKKGGGGQANAARQGAGEPRNERRNKQGPGEPRERRSEPRSEHRSKQGTGAPQSEHRSKQGAGEPRGDRRVQGAGAAQVSGPATSGSAVLKLGRHKGEWMEIRLPDQLAGAPLQAVLKHLPIPSKLTSKLLHARGLLLQGPNLRLHLFPREQRDFPPDWMELNILYEDEFTLVVNKPAGIEVHPSEHGQRRTLAHGVSAYYEMSGQDVRIRHIHRIDKETTGPVLYAKNEFAHYQYDKAMREKKIERAYLALAEGNLKPDKGVIDQPIGKDRHHSTRRRVSETGDPAVTHYQVVERFGDHTLVRLRLETGRTHQIRVHLAAIGHPLAGDGMYGGTRNIISRQALHGEKLIWLHPWTGEKQQVRAPLPDDFNQALDELRKRKTR